MRHAIFYTLKTVGSTYHCNFVLPKMCVSTSLTCRPCLPSLFSHGRFFSFSSRPRRAPTSPASHATPSSPPRAPTLPEPACPTSTPRPLMALPPPRAPTLKHRALSRFSPPSQHVGSSGTSFDMWLQAKLEC